MLRICTAGAYPTFIVANLRPSNCHRTVSRLLYQSIISEDALTGFVFKSLNNVSVSFMNSFVFSMWCRILLSESIGASFSSSKYFKFNTCPDGTLQ